MNLLRLAILGRRIKAIPRMLSDRSVSFWKKAIVIFGIIYLVLPVDLIPPIVPVFGFLDDVVLWALILYYLRDVLDRYDVPSPGPGPFAKKKRGDKDAIDVTFTVKEEEEKKDV